MRCRVPVSYTHLDVYKRQIIICLLVGLKIFPPIGMLKKAYRRVEQGGAVLDEKDARIEEINADDLKAASPVNFLIPVDVYKRQGRSGDAAFS